MTPEEEFSSLYSPLPPGFPEPLDSPPLPSHLDFQLAIHWGEGGVWIISGITLWNSPHANIDQISIEIFCLMITNYI